MLDKIYSFIEKHNLIQPNSKIVLGLSGGPDSVFLLHLLSKMPIIAAHLDHEWRPESHKDEEFCRKLTDKLGILYIARKISELPLEMKFEGSKEAFGRQARRLFLEEVCRENNFDFIALAHHLQDQEETFFIRLIRGSSLTGLTAMRPKCGKYIRPLLETNKSEIINYLQENGIEYLTDPSNMSESFLRNRIRNRVVPALQECDDRFDSNFLTTLHRLQETEAFLEMETCKVYESISENSGINLKKFFNLDPFIQRRVILHWLCHNGVPFTITQNFLEEVIRFLRQPESKDHAIHEAWSIVKKGELATISRK